MKYTIVVAEFNNAITEPMLKECLRGFEEREVAREDLEIVRVLGAVEVPLACKRAAEGGANAIIALGCVVEGETDHYRAVCDMCSRGIMDVMLATGVPIVFEVLMVDSYQKAEARIEKGYHAAEVAMKMLEGE
jgi:6,7-dimethyl-8-ribityllumazine synthase